jgi:hypothetical protein
MSFAVTASSSIAPGDSGLATVVCTAGEPGLAIPLTGVQTYNVDLAMIPSNGAQAWMVRVDALDASGAVAAAPVRVNFTPGGYRYVSPGGWLVEAAPKTGVGVTALQLVSTANALVHVTVFG